MTDNATPLRSSPLPGVASLEANLEICQAEIRNALARAQTIDPAKDEFGHIAAGAYDQAMAFLGMSAKIGMALGKMKGEHTSNINVRKTETVEARPNVLEPRRLAPRPGHVPIGPHPMDAAAEARANKIYNDWLAANAAREQAAAKGGDDGADDADDEEDWEEGDPPSENGGSNTSVA